MLQHTLAFSKMTDGEVREALRAHNICLTVEEARKIETMLGRPPTLTEATIWGIQGSEHCSYKSSRRFLQSFPTTGKHVILGPTEDSGIVAITDAPKGKRWGLVVSHESHNHPSQIVPYEGAATGVGGCVRDVLCMGARVIGSMDSLRLGDLKTDESRAIAAEVIRGIAGYGNALGIPNLGGDTMFDAAYNSNCLVNVVSIGIIREDEIIHSSIQREAGAVGYDILVVGKPTDRSGFGGAAFASLAMEGKDKEKNAGAVQEPNPFLERHLLASSYALFDWLAREGKLHLVSFKDHGAGGNVCASVEQVAPLGLGADIDLDRVHTASPDLPPEVIACAETQERLCWICHPELTAFILKHYNEVWDLPSVAEGAQASVIGKVTPDGIYTLRHKGEVVCSATSRDITSGLQYVRETKQPDTHYAEPSISCKGNTVHCGKHPFETSEKCLLLRQLRQNFAQRMSIRLAKFCLASSHEAIFERFLPIVMFDDADHFSEIPFLIDDIFSAMLSHPTHGSKSRVFRHYDKNILGNTLIEPGEADASVILPLLDLRSEEIDVTHPDWVEALPHGDKVVGVALACGGNGRYGRISPFLQGVNAVAENVRNIVATGALPRAITDCLNEGNPEIPEHLWALEQGVAGITAAARGLAMDGEPIPVISGNVSLYNATKEGPIDPTAIVCVMGTMPDARRAITMQLQSSDSALFLIGDRADECGGSAYYQILEQLCGCKTNALLGKNVPSPDFAQLRKEIDFLHRAISEGMIRSCHDISDGGLLLALFEMMLPQRGTGGSIGMTIDVSEVGPGLRNDTVLFSETGGFVIEIPPNQVQKIKEMAGCAGVSPIAIGHTQRPAAINIERSGSVLLSSPLKTLQDVWADALERALGSS